MKMDQEADLNALGGKLGTPTATECEKATQGDVEGDRSCGRSGRRNKCTSAAILLGLVKSRSRQPAKSSNPPSGSQNITSSLSGSKLTKVKAAASTKLNLEMNVVQTSSSPCGNFYTSVLFLGHDMLFKPHKKSSTEH
jgi:hypothetical protein